MNEVKVNTLLEEILPTPANQIITDRFANAADENAGCNGKCQTDGVCMAV